MSNPIPKTSSHSIAPVLLDRPAVESWHEDAIFPQQQDPHFNRFVERLLVDLVSYGSRRWQAKWRVDDIKELASDAVNASIRRLPDLAHYTYRRFFGYNRAILNRRVINEHNAVKRSFERSIGQFPDAYDTSQDIDYAEQIDLLLDLDEAIDCLSATEFRVVAMKGQGFLIREIADVLEISLRAVGYHWSRAKKKLHERLG